MTAATWGRCPTPRRPGELLTRGDESPPPARPRLGGRRNDGISLDRKVPSREQGRPTVANPTRGGRRDCGGDSPAGPPRVALDVRPLPPRRRARRGGRRGFWSSKPPGGEHGPSHRPRRAAVRGAASDRRRPAGRGRRSRGGHRSRPGAVRESTTPTPASPPEVPGGQRPVGRARRDPATSRAARAT